MTKPILATFLLVLAAACQLSPRGDPKAFRDLGIQGAGTPMAEVYCAGQPTEAQFAQLDDVGVTKVVHLRAATEDGTGWEEAVARREGIEFVRLPIGGGDDVTVGDAQALARELQSARGIVLVSAGSSNRVGALLAMKARHVDGKSPDEAMAIAAQCGMKELAPGMREKLGK